VAVLVASFAYQINSGESRPPGLTTVLIPANLFTGVLACGIICLLNPWIDWKLPAQMRSSTVLSVANLIAAIAFIAIGVKGYWDFGGSQALGILACTIAGGFVVAIALRNQV
jgi:quinol-cytochrome oxidoreductase complex cytochrome b subunit